MKFKTKVIRGGEGDAWMLVMVPSRVTKALGSLGRISVVGEVNGFPIKTSIFPNGDGTHHMMFNKVMQKGAKATAGDTVEVELERAPGK